MTDQKEKLIITGISIIIASSFIGLLFTTMATIKVISLSFLFVSILALYTFIFKNSKFKTHNSHDSNNLKLNIFIKELQQLHELMVSTIKDDINVVNAEITQIKQVVSDAVKQLTLSFDGVSINTLEQQHLVKSIIDAINKDGCKDRLLDLNNTTHKIQSCSNTAIQSLQFEDIVIQVADNGIQYLKDIEKFLDELETHLCEYVNNLTDVNSFNNKNIALVSVIKQARQQRIAPDRKAVHQQDMSVGGVELF